MGKLKEKQENERRRRNGKWWEKDKEKRVESRGKERGGIHSIIADATTAINIIVDDTDMEATRGGIFEVVEAAESAYKNE